MSADHNRRVPEDLMGAILGASPGFDEEEQAVPEPGDATVSWEDGPELVGVAFNLSKQLNAELDRIRHELAEDTHPSKSEIAEVALRIAVEDFRSRDRESELAERIEERHAARKASGDTPHSVVRSVDQSGLILETTYDQIGEVLDEDVVGRVSDLPVVDEYLDEQGRLVSQVKDDLGNTFEQILDDNLNTLETRLLEGP
jgi:vacuolar-type H+-ATPase subunit E/Vma4